MLRKNSRCTIMGGPWRTNNSDVRRNSSWTPPTRSSGAGDTLCSGTSEASFSLPRLNGRTVSLLHLQQLDPHPIRILLCGAFEKSALRLDGGYAA